MKPALVIFSTAFELKASKLNIDPLIEPVLLNNHTSFAEPTATATRFGTICPATRFRFDDTGLVGVVDVFG